MKQIVYLSIAILGLMLIACGNQLEIKEFSPDKDVSRTQTFTVRLNEDICPPEMQNKWMTEEFMEFEPKIRGKYKWISANTFVFSPDTKLHPMQKYFGHLTDKALFGNAELVIGGDDAEFNTPDFRAETAEFYWANIPNQYYKANIQINAVFNYPVYADKIRNFITVKLNGTEVKSYKFTNPTETEKLSISIENVQQTDKEQEIELTIRKGAECIYGKKPMEADANYKYTLPAITQLEVSGSASGFDGANGWLEIAFTQAVKEEEFAKYISFNPQKSAEYLFMDNKVRISGQFENASNITVMLKKGLPGTVGGTLQEDFEQDFSFVNLAPSINFADSKGKYLKYSGERTLEVNAVNLDEVEIEVCRIYKNNLLYYLNQNDDSYYDEIYPQSAIYPDNYGKSLYKEVKVLKNEQNWLEKFQVNLNSSIQTNEKGLYLINVSSTQDRWISASKTLALTDIGIIAKKSGDELVVFANSIATTEPIAGVEISLISTNNQVILNGHTDDKGVATFRGTKKYIQDFVPRLIVAETKEDFNYIDLDRTNIETSRYDVAGTYEDNDTYSAYIYTERDLYRPAETAHISAIIRDKAMQPVQDLPLILKIISPNGGVFREFSTNVNKEGSFELAVDFPASSLTGIYRAELYTASGEFINSHILNIEDFVPDKIRVALKTNAENYKPSDKVSVAIDAEFLFGAKASGLRWTADFHLVQKEYTNDKYKDYSFKGKPSEYPYNQHYYTDGVLDDQGKGTAEYNIPSDAKCSGYIEGYAVISVFDLNGRTVTKSTRYKVFPNDNFAGIKMNGYYFGTKQNISAKTVLLSKLGELAPNKAITTKLVRYEWKTVLKKDYSEKFFYSSEEKQYIEWEKELTSATSPKDIKFAVEKSGKYELRIAEKNSENYSSAEFYAYSWSSSTAGSFETDKEGRIEIITDKEKYNTGDKAKILFTTPFNGKMLVTLERNGVEHYEYVNVENRSAELILPIEDKYLPNIYVSATLFKKHSIDKSTPFFVAHGYASLNVEKSSNKINVEIVSPNIIKPNTTAKISVKTGVANSYITLSAVDEGILQLYNFKTPDPYKYFYSKKALKTQSYDLYKYLLPEIARTSSSTGGGGEMDEADMNALVNSRSNPIKTKRFKPFSYWSGIVPTNSSGTANFSVNIPNINTEVRLMAVAYQGNKFGAADKYIKVFNDLIIEPEIPRFLSPNDDLIMPVTIINTTNSRQSVKLAVSATNALYLTSSNTSAITVEANSHTTVEFKVKAKNEIGEGQIRITAAGSSKSEEVVDIGVRPSNPFTTTTKSGIIYAGQTVNLQIPDSYYPKLVKANLVVSKLHATNYAGLLKKLIDYPHGCLEQTVSKAFPMLYMSDLAGLIAPTAFRNSNPIYYINEAINKVSSMQKWDGGLSYWENEYQTNSWASVYGAHFLVAAKQAKYQVNPKVLDNLLRFIAKNAKKPVTYDYAYYENSKRITKKIAAKEILYSLYVLALAGKPDLPTMNYYKAHKELLSNDSRYLLAAAFAYSGNLNTFHQLIPNQFTAEWNGRFTGYDFDSYIRSNAIMLSVLADLDPNNQQIPQLVKFLNTNAITQGKAESTQDLAFTLLALGKVAKGQEKSNINVDLYANGKKIKSSSNQDMSLSEDEFQFSSVSMKANGVGLNYYYLTIDGIPKSKAVDTDNNLKVRREFIDYRTKKPVSWQNIRQGQILACKISLTSPAQRIENIAITNLLPACFEIENPRLPEVHKATFTSPNQMTIRNLDIRDDRLTLFTDINANQTKEYYFLVRVVNRGNYSVPPISAEAMYAPSDYRSVSGTSYLSIK